MSQAYVDGITDTVPHSIASSLTAGGIRPRRGTITISVVSPDRWILGDFAVVTSRDGRAFAGEVEGMDVCTGEVAHQGRRATGAPATRLRGLRSRGLRNRREPMRTGLVRRPRYGLPRAPGRCWSGRVPAGPGRSTGIARRARTSGRPRRRGRRCGPPGPATRTWRTARASSLTAGVVPGRDLGHRTAVRGRGQQAPRGTDHGGRVLCGPG